MKRVSKLCFLGSIALVASIAHAESERLPLITCHRGGYEYDDNALGSFKDSVKAGLKRLETDFRFTRDHQFVLMHDDTMDRTTTGKGYVEDWTLAELSKLRLKRSGEPIPTGESVLEYFKGRKDIFLLLEMKTYNHKPGVTFYTDEVVEEYCRKLSRLVTANLVPGTYTYTSTDYRSLRIMHRIEPNAKITVTLYDQFSDTWLKVAKDLNCYIFGQWIGGLHPGDVERIHAAGMKVDLWPILNMGDYVRARKLGADTVCVDTPKEFMRRIKMKQCDAYAHGSIRTSWDKTSLKIVTPLLSRTYKLTVCGLETAEAVRSPDSDFTRCTAGCLKLGDEVGVRVTVLTDYGEQQVDIKASQPEPIVRTLPTNVQFVRRMRK